MSEERRDRSEGERESEREREKDFTKQIYSRKELYIKPLTSFFPSLIAAYIVSAVALYYCSYS